LDVAGRSSFHDLMARCGEPRYYAFDLVWRTAVICGDSRFWSASEADAG
jgi:hypothetical protein